MATNKRGLLISFDGLDCSGKATQTDRLVGRLQKEGYVVHTFESPDYTTPSGMELKQRLQGKLGDWQTTPWQEKLTYFADNRAEHRQEVVDALQAGDVVVYDRYVPSSLAFMAIEAMQEAHPAPPEDVYKAVRSYEHDRNGMPREDLSIFLDMPPSLALTLLSDRKQQQQDEDEYTDQLEIQQRLYDHYQHMINQEDTVVAIPCTQNNAVLPINTIADSVWTQVMRIL